MKSMLPGIRKPVRRQGADRYLFIMLLSFAASISLTRLFLELTGYPQLGGGGLHIAHVLWGGVLLFIASLLPLVYANRWAYVLGALLSGVGVGLFIDEVGKFITQNNDYFYPAAAPLIYAFFLLTVLFYLQVRRPVSRDPRTELYRSLDILADVLDHDLDKEEWADLVARLTYVASQASHPDLSSLASQLLDFISREGLYLAPRLPTTFTSLQQRFDELEKRYLSRLRLRAALAGGMGTIGLVALSKLAQVLLVRFGTVSFEESLVGLVQAGILPNSGAVGFFLVRVILEAIVGISLFLSALFLAAGHEWRGIRLAYLSLMMSLVGVNVILFYFEQFSTIVVAIMQLGLLVGILYYRRRFLPEPPVSPGAAKS